MVLPEMGHGNNACHKYSIFLIFPRILVINTAFLRIILEMVGLEKLQEILILVSLSEVHVTDITHFYLVSKVRMTLLGEAMPFNLKV